MNLTPLPLLEAHFFLANRAHGFLPAAFINEKIELSHGKLDHLKGASGIIAELNMRLERRVKPDDAELMKIYRSLNMADVEGDVGNFTVADMVIGGIEHLADEQSLQRTLSDTDGVYRRLVERMLGEDADCNVGLGSLMELITSSRLPDESKLLLIDTILHTDKYQAMLADALVPIALEFESCSELIAPLLRIYEQSCYDYAGPSADDTEIFNALIKSDENSHVSYTIHPLVTYFNRAVFGFTDEDHKGVFGGIGVLYFDLRLYNRRDINAKLSEIMTVLGSRSRFDILALIAQGPKYGRELASHLGLTPATVSHHINHLLAIELIRVENDGVRAYYSLNYDKTDEFVRMLSSLLKRRD